jgi:diguanylate cyclase (GGDEF)-like protein
LPSERIQRRVEQLLDEADAAAAALDWARVGALCDGVLRLDPGNPDALAYLEASNRDTRAPVESRREAEPVPAAGSFAGGRYVVTRFLGEGARKRVYLAHDSVLDRDVAFALVKTGGADSSARARVLREAQVMARLGEHPNIMPIYDLGTEGAEPYMVLPLMPGGDVESLIASAPDHRMPLEGVLEIGLAILSGLEFAHSHGVIHRDLKPGNVWLGAPFRTAGGSMPAATGTIKIGDFGLALPTHEVRLTAHGLMVGTAAYMPPEQALGGEITAKADLYSFGCMLYELVTGRPPFLGDDQLGIIGQQVNTPPVAPTWHNPECPLPLEALVMRLLAKDPADRPASAADARAALLEIRPVQESTTSRPKQPERALESMSTGVFVGRRRETDALRAALEDALTGHGRLVMLSGAPGIGKTRIAAELATYAALRSCQVLWGRCYEGTGAPPYWPWVQAVRSYVRDRDPEGLRSELGTGAGVIAEIVSEIRQRLPDLRRPPALDSPDAARFRLFDSMAAFLHGAARSRPIMLVLDDVQWADRPSLLLLEFLARDLANARVLVVGTYRDDGLTRQHPLAEALGGLSRERLFERISLDGLGLEDVARFIEIASGVKPPAALSSAVHTQTEGNPLFVTEVVRLLVQDGSLTSQGVQDGRPWTVRIPEGVRQVIGRRLNHLSPACADALVAAAVIGRAFGLEELRAVLERESERERTERELLDLLEEASAARLIEETPGSVGRYQFSHALMRETLLEELSQNRRVRMHATVARSLEALYAGQADAPAAELAHHFEAAQPVLGIDGFVKHSLAAGERALGRFAYEEAVQHFEGALAAKLAPTSEPYGPQTVSDMETADLLCGLACARAAVIHRAGLQGTIDHLRLVFDYYVHSGQPRKAAEAVLRFPTPKVHATFGLASLLSDALRLVEPESTAAGRLLARLGLFLSFEHGEYRPAIESLNHALRIAEKAGDTALEVHTRANVAIVEWMHLHIDDAVKAALHASELASHTGDSRLQFESHEIATTLLGVTGKSQPAARHARAALECAEKLRSRLPLTLALAANADLAVFVGDWDRITELANRDRSGGQPDQRLITPLLWSLLQTGQFRRADEIVRDPFLRPASFASTLVAFAGRSRLDGLDDADVENLEAQAKALLTRPDVEPGGHLVARVTLSLSAVSRRDERQARQMYEALQPLTRLALVHVGISIDRLKGLLASVFGRPDLARSHFEDALRFVRDAGYRPELAWTCHDLAELLLVTGNPDDLERAAGLIREGAAASVELGMKPLHSRLAELWRRASAAEGTPGRLSPVAADDRSAHRVRISTVVDRRQLLALLSLDLELLRARPSGLALVRLDLDDLGAINQVHGLAAGDALLRAIASSLQDSVGRGATVAHLEGDDFLLVLRRVDPRTALSRAAGLARKVLDTHVDAAGERIRTSCTAGVVMAPSGRSITVEEMLTLAEEALAHAREAGSTTAHFYDPGEGDRSSIAALQEARLSIVAALEEDRFLLVRMPIFRVPDRTVSHYEVLVRMRSRDGDIVAPGDFIPQAESVDLIQRVDRRVIELTMQRWRAYADAGQVLNLAVNVSARSMSVALVDFIGEQADRWSVEHACLTLELTETAVSRDEARAGEVAGRLRGLGFKVAIDDFGSGTTSLRRIRALAFDYLKLDGSLIAKLASSEPDRQFVSALVKLAREMRESPVEIVAEFVSDEETMRFLSELGVEYAQGFYLGRPEDFPAAAAPTTAPSRR